MNLSPADLIELVSIEPVEGFHDERPHDDKKVEIFYLSTILEPHPRVSQETPMFRKSGRRNNGKLYFLSHLKCPFAPKPAV